MASLKVPQGLQISVEGEDERGKQEEGWTDPEIQKRVQLIESVDGPRNEFDDILDINNPPKLQRWHYGMLRRLDKLTDVDSKLTLEEKEVKMRFLKHKEDPDNPLFWDDLKWEKHTRVGRQMPAWDPWYEPSPGDLSGILNSDPNQLTNFRLKNKWGVPARKKNRCLLCKFDHTPHRGRDLVPTNVELLTKFMNERGMILARKVTGICSKHQRRVARVIKHARTFGVISPISNWKVPPNYRQTSYVTRHESLLPPKHPKPGALWGEDEIPYQEGEMMEEEEEEEGESGDEEVDPRLEAEAARIARR